MTSSAALVLSGGGARGAYEVGIVRGLTDVLGVARRSPFDVFTGTSVGAINATYLAAHAELGDGGIEGLVHLWESLEIEEHLRIDPAGLMGWPLGAEDGNPRRGIRFLQRLVGRDPKELGERYGRAMIDPRPLERIVEAGVPWHRLRENVDSGIVRALVVSALDVAGGRTTIFCDVAPGTHVTPSRDVRRETRPDRITAQHVLASAAIPFFFPARRIGDTFYCDGGLRFNTPISPALRAGAEKLVVVSLLHGTPPAVTRAEILAEYPSPLFLAGKVLNALLLDPIDYDLTVLERFNKVMEVLESTLDATEFERVSRVLEEDRGMRYRRVQTLVFRPSADIGVLAGEHLVKHEAKLAKRARLTSFLLRRAAALSTSTETDFGSFLLFDGGFAKSLIDLGHRDVLARRDDVKRFFDA